MKKIIALITVSIFAVAFSGCNSSIKGSDYIEVSDYKGLKVERMDTTVTDEDVQKEIDLILSSLSTTEKVTDRNTVEKGDIANIDYVGKKDGVAFDGGSAKGYDLEIGGGRFIEGFEEGLIGAKVGETVLLKLSFPEVYPNNPDLAGVPVTFEVKVNSISKIVTPELTDELVISRTNGECNNVADFKAMIKDDLSKDKNQFADTRMYSDLIKIVVDKATLKKDIPEEYLQKKIDVMKNNVKTYADSYGVDYNTFLRNYMGLEPDDFVKQCEEEAGAAAKQSLVISAIAEKENIKVTKSELNDAIEEYTIMYGYESEKAFKDQTDMDQFKEYILESKVQEFLADNAVITVSDEKAW